MRAVLPVLLAIGLSAPIACASAPKPKYARFDDVAYGYSIERSVWSPRAGVWIHVAEVPADPKDTAAATALPIVLVHPWGTNMLIWSDVAPKLATHRRILLLDLPGHGKSGKPPGDYPLRRLAGAVIDAMDDAKMKRGVIVGNSIGGATAIEVGLSAPSRVEALVLIGAPGGAPLPQPIQLAVANGARPRNLETLAPFGYVLAWLTMTPNMPPLADRMLDDLLALRSTAEWPAWSRATSASLREVVRYQPKVEAIRARVLVVQGGNDLVVPAEQGEALARRIPNAKLVRLQTCGHVPEIECPQLLVQEIEAFLSAGA
jgi:pimeloyl-ACP methyl ester carboxylesterase